MPKRSCLRLERHLGITCGVVDRIPVCYLRVSYGVRNEQPIVAVASYVRSQATVSGLRFDRSKSGHMLMAREDKIDSDARGQPRAPDADSLFGKPGGRYSPV